MAKLKKYIAEAVRDEIEVSETVSSLLKQLTHKYIAEQKKMFGKKNAKNNKQYQTTLSRAEIIEKILKIHKRYQIAIPHIKINNQPPLSFEQKLIINWDFEGINIHKENLKLSTYFKNALNTSKNYNVAHRHDPSEYNLEQIPIWNEMKKFKNFQQMSAPLRQQLAKLGFDPS